MKTKIKVPDSDGWPLQWRGKEVWVEVDNIRFPDGFSWSVAGIDADAVESPPPPPTGLPQIFGQKLKRMDVEFET